MNNKGFKQLLRFLSLFMVIGLSITCSDPGTSFEEPDVPEVPDAPDNETLSVGTILSTEYLKPNSMKYYKVSGLDPKSNYCIRINADNNYNKYVYYDSGHHYNDEIILGIDNIDIYIYSSEMAVSYSIELINCEIRAGTFLTSQTIKDGRSYFVLVMDRANTHTLTISNLSADVTVCLTLYLNFTETTYYAIDSDSDGIITLTGLDRNINYTYLYGYIRNDNIDVTYDLSFIQN